jgi:small subunit ribosomal protein S1
VRGFCPISHISDVRTEDVDQHLGQTYTFKVLEYEPEGQRLVVSRAAHLNEEKQRLREEAWSKLEVGAEVEGRVRSLTDFGAFVELGGVDGLVHVTEIAHHRVNHPREELQLEQQVRVKILDLDREKDRISLSIKALVEDPWIAAAQKYAARGPFEGTVVRKTDFGIFVQLESGVDGLLHVSQLRPGQEIDTPEFEVGETVRGFVRDVDADNRRIGLTMRQVPDRDPWERIEMRYQEGQTVEGTVENGADFGVFVELEPGLSGLIPISELGLERDADPRDVFAPGEKLKLKLMALDPNRRRISLSVRALKRDLERQEYTPHMESGADAAPAVTGFGAQLAAALDKGEKKKAPTTEKKAPAKKTTEKKASAKKAPAKKAAVKKPAAKKPAAKKTPAKKKTAAKKTAPKKAAEKE